MKKNTMLKDMLLVALIICAFTAVGGALNGEIAAFIFLLALSCIFLCFLYIRKKPRKYKKCVDLSRNPRVNHAA